MAHAQSEYIYWSDTQENAIYRGLADGSSYEKILASRNPGKYAMRDSVLFWEDKTTNTLNQTTLETSVTDTLLSVGDVRGLEIGTDGRTIYWAAVDDTVTQIQMLTLAEGIRDTLVTVPSEGVSFEIDSQTAHIYWTDNEAIYRRELSGGDPEIIRDSLTRPGRLTLDREQGKIYWISEETIYRSLVNGSAVETVASGASPGTILDVSDQSYYWVQGDSLVKRASMDGTGEEVVAEMPATPYTNIRVHEIHELSINAEENRLYWLGGGVITAANIWRFDLTDKTAETIFIGFVGPSGLTVNADTGHLYVTAGQGKVLRSDLDGKNVREITQVPCGIGQLTDIVVDEMRDRLYWGHTTDCPSYDIYRSDLSGNGVQIVKAFNQPWGLALDAQNNELYWTEHAPYVLERANIDTLFEKQTHNDVLGDVHPWGVAINSKSERIYWTDPYESAITRADLNGQNREALVSGLEEPRDLSMDANGDAMYWVEKDAGVIRRANLDGSNVEMLFSGLKAPEYLALTFETRQVLSADHPADLPEKVRLHGNYPNPFNPSTIILYDLVRSTDVEIHVYDVVGRKVATLVDRIQSAGRHTVSFDGSYLPSGMYLYRLETPAETLTKQMLLIK